MLSLQAAEHVRHQSEDHGGVVILDTAGRIVDDAQPDRWPLLAKLAVRQGVLKKVLRMWRPGTRTSRSNRYARTPRT